MNKQTQRLRAKSLFFAIFSLTLTACEQAPAPAPAQQPQQVVKAETPEEAVARRAKERVDAMSQGKLETAYSYFSPGTQVKISMQSFYARQSRSPAQWKSAEVESVSCVQDVCEAKVNLTYIYAGSISAMAGQEQTSRLTEKWVKADDGLWYLVQDK